MEDFFKHLTTFLEKQVLPLQHQLDTDEQLLKKFFEQLVTLGALKLMVPQAEGGMGGERVEWIRYNILLAQYSGALLFLQAQHQFAVTQLKKLLPHPKISALLQDLALQNNGLGIYRARKGNFQLQETAKGFFLNGELKWVTGFNYLTKILFNFDHNDNLFSTLLPFESAKSVEGQLVISGCKETAVFKSTNTVSIELNDWFIPHQDILSVQKMTQPSVPQEHPSIYTFAGVAKALLEIAATGKYAFVEKAKQQQQILSEVWQQYYDEIMDGQHHPLTLRAKGASLANRCAQFARMICASESLLAEHPLNRLCRETWQYTIAGYTEDQLEAYLDA